MNELNIQLVCITGFQIRTPNGLLSSNLLNPLAMCSQSPL